MNPSPLPSLLAAAGLIILVMFGVWRVALRIRNAGIVDIAWSLNFAPLAWLYAAVSPGYGPRRLLVALMVTFWSFRLGGYLYRRVIGHHPIEDGRHQQRRKDWAPNGDRPLLWFFQLQGLLNVALSVPFLLAARNPEPALSALEWAARTPRTGGGRVGSGSGATRATPTTSSSGSFGWPTSCWR
jgi:steroid 5-alpha reductase family enzyme